MLGDRFGTIGSLRTAIAETSVSVVAPPVEKGRIPSPSIPSS